MMIRKRVNYLEKARALAARRARAGGTAPPAAAPVAPRRDGEERPEAPEPAPRPSASNGTRNHALIGTPEDLTLLAASLGDVGRVALDSKTTGPDPREDRIRLITLATERGTWLVDCFKVDPRPLFPVLTQKEIVVHDGLHNLGFLFRMGFEPGGNGKVIDTMLMSQMLEGRHPKGKEAE